MHKFLWLSWIKAIFLDLLLFIKFYFILHICLLRTYIFYSEDHLSGAVVRLNNSQLRNSYLDLPPEQVTPWYAALRLFNQTLDLHSIRNKLRSGECVMQEKNRCWNSAFPEPWGRGWPFWSSVTISFVLLASQVWSLGCVWNIYSEPSEFCYDPNLWEEFLCGMTSVLLILSCSFPGNLNDIIINLSVISLSWSWT